MQNKTNGKLVARRLEAIRTREMEADQREIEAIRARRIAMRKALNARKTTNKVAHRAVFLLFAGVTAVAVIASLAATAGRADQGAAPVFLKEKPAGYRDWTVISVSHEAGNINSIGAVLGNDVAVKAYREGKLPFPDGSIIAAIHYKYVPSEENNKVFGQAQSFVAGAPTNVQFEVKDSKKYAATGGWGFGHFNSDGSLGGEALMKTCAPCHAKASQDFVFTHYAP